MTDFDVDGNVMGNRHYPNTTHIRSPRGMDEMRTQQPRVSRSPFGVHVPREGQPVLIAEMDDAWLINMVRAAFRRAAEAKNVLKQQRGGSTFSRALYNLPTINEEAVGQMCREAVEFAAPYLVEAFIRGNEEIRKMLCALVERDAAMPDHNLLMLTSSEDTHISQGEEVQGYDIDDMVDA